MLSSQYATLKNYISSDTTLLAWAQVNNWSDIADTLNAQASPLFYVWKTACSVDDISDAIIWANMTPVDAPDSTTVWTNRSLACQGKQFNLQTLISGKTNINASKQNVRQCLQDSLTNLPAGASGTLIGAGWPQVRTAMMRTVSLIEKIYATGTGTTASPAIPSYEGIIIPNQVMTAFLMG